MQKKHLAGLLAVIIIYHYCGYWTLQMLPEDQPPLLSPWAIASHLCHPGSRTECLPLFLSGQSESHRQPRRKPQARLPFFLGPLTTALGWERPHPSSPVSGSAGYWEARELPSRATEPQAPPRPPGHCTQKGEALHPFPLPFGFPSIFCQERLLCVGIKEGCW